MSLLARLRVIPILLPWLLGLLLVDLLCSLLLPLAGLAPDFVYHASSLLAGTSWTWIQFIFEVVNGGVITFAGAPVPDRESAIVVANHVSWTDFYLIQALAMRAGMLTRCRWFAKRELRWVPLLGWGLWAMGMPLVSRQWTRDQPELERVLAGIRRRGWPTCKWPRGSRPRPARARRR